MTEAVQEVARHSNTIEEPGEVSRNRHVMPSSLQKSSHAITPLPRTGTGVSAASSLQSLDNVKPPLSSGHILSPKPVMMRGHLDVAMCCLNAATVKSV
eukprot:CAMPEP_0178463724 /NCGR_PEP_ID=MMETSP0689_2-20121128/50478_1 /TAXON_ID=160604 /ORGANISM="Amphidinium massartii, Strain CS-259" /LENGTH=97 /DNA_ID=CAMNT_0020090611 /DNA_START=475 /DNA_END=768 /DNA_ORIENTATION=-